jgi:hypothetical protein
VWCQSIKEYHWVGCVIYFHDILSLIYLNNIDTLTKTKSIFFRGVFGSEVFS